MPVGSRLLRRLAAGSVFGLTLLLAACDSDPGSSASPAAKLTDHAVFLERHWQRPLAPQGAAPSSFAPLEASLDPAACGSCHPRQFEDWRTTLHSRAMGPGLVGQLQEMDADAVDEHQACLRCHAPLVEQAEDLRRTLAAADVCPQPLRVRPPRGRATVSGRPGDSCSSAVVPRADGAAHAHGLTCAGCHLREHRRFGPPRRDGSAPSAGDALPHGGWEASTAFEDSRFCAACHQFELDGFSLAGKLLENTYEEWRASRHARENRSCQSCHMPDRRHLWRGIHDPEMVKAGLAIETSAPTLSGGRIKADLRIANHGVGHAFPTYVTPHVIVEIGQADGTGGLISDTVERHLIARDVSLDLSVERADTRILPDELRRYGYDRPLHPRASTLAVRIRVEPDAFYAEFYRATLRDPGTGKGRQALRRALNDAERSGYVLYESQQALTPR